MSDLRGINMFLADKWQDYRLADAANGEKLEYWGDFLLRRPDPLAAWNVVTEKGLWSKADAIYHRSAKGGGSWEFKNEKMPERWTVNYGELTFNIHPTGFKHTGLFPEQAANWDWFSELIRRSGRKIRLLNLFAYTGGASVAAAAAGAEVVHVDAAKGMVTWAKDNIVSSSLADKPIRYIVDDVKKFVLREQRRGREYDAIIMDPPSYGRGPGGEVWKIEEQLFPLVCECVKLMSDKPLFFLINSYTAGLSAQVLSNILSLTMGRKYGGITDCDEIGLPISSNSLVLPCGISGRWSANA